MAVQVGALKPKTTSVGCNGDTLVHVSPSELTSGVTLIYATRTMDTAAEVQYEAEFYAKSTQTLNLPEAVSAKLNGTTYTGQMKLFMSFLSSGTFTVDVYHKDTGLYYYRHSGAFTTIADLYGVTLANNDSTCNAYDTGTVRLNSDKSADVCPAWTLQYTLSGANSSTCSCAATNRTSFPNFTHYTASGVAVDGTFTVYYYGTLAGYHRYGLVTTTSSVQLTGWNNSSCSGGSSFSDTSTDVGYFIDLYPADNSVFISYAKVFYPVPDTLVHYSGTLAQGTYGLGDSIGTSSSYACGNLAQSTDFPIAAGTVTAVQTP